MSTLRRAFCLLALSAALARADSFTIRADWFDRGNVDAGRVARRYADQYPCIVNGGEVPNRAEYDLDFPVTADYTLHALYTAHQPRPVDVWVDDQKIVRGFAATTGSWMTSRAKWEEQGTVRISKGRHTVKLVCPGPCIPHICALRFEAEQAFPEDWQLDRRAARERPQPPAPADEGQREGFVGCYPVEPPDTYDYKQPYDPVPLPAPRAHRILEYTLLGGDYAVEATLVGPASTKAAARHDAKDPRRNELLQAAPAGGEGDAPWAAHLSVAVDGRRTETAVLPLSPGHLRKMLRHAQRLIDDFRATEGVGDDYLADERAQASRIAAELEALLAEPDSQAKGQALYRLYLQAYQLKHRVALQNPLLDFPAIVLAKRPTYNTSHIYTTYYDGSGRYKAGSGIFLLAPVRPAGRLTRLTEGMKGDGIYRDPDLSWDARRVLFAFKPDPRTPFHIYEVGADGEGLRQVTRGVYDDVDPCYLPDGRIAFISTRTERVTLCHNAFTVSNLHTMAADGSGVRCISTNTIHDFTPSVLADGQIAVSQWRYVDKHVGNNQSLWRCNPDGTHCVHIAGAHFGPVTYWGPRQVPSSRRIACILGPHMPYAVGPVALVDPLFTYTSPQVYTNLTPQIPPPTHNTWHRREAGFYADVFPLSEDYFLVAYCYGPDEREPTGYGIYLLDRWNNRDLVYRDPRLSAFEAFPLEPRPRPPVISPPAEPVAASPAHASPEEAEWGTFYCLDVYRGLPGIERGEVKYLRVVEEVPKPVASRTRGHRLQNPAISDTGHFALKRLWGTVPVEPDGSAHFHAPASKAIYFSALDEQFMEVQRMRTFTTVAPGERQGCIGCHERKTTSPPNGPVAALGRAPSEIEPPPHGGVHAPDFAYDVQPVLDRHCVRCHSRPKPKGGIELSPDYTPIFNVAYETLVRRGLVSFVNIYQVSTLVARPPKYYGSHASKLVRVLRTSHKDRVEMPPEDFRRLVTWIDANAPYYGTYVYTRPGTTGGRDIFARHHKTLDDVHKRRCAACHGQNALATVYRMRLPARDTRALRAPLAKGAGGDETCGKPVFADTADPDYRKLRDVYAAIAANPRVDMRDERPPLTDPRCRYVYRPGVVRQRGE
ncbi:MAG: hypothetical protein ACLF0G_15450 [Candidatus Brocadiia bacterium]